MLETLNELEPFCEFLTNLFALSRTHRFLELFVEFVEIDFGEKFLDRFSAHARDEIFAILLLRFTILHFVQQLCFLQRRFARIDHNVVLVVDHAFELTRGHIEHQPNA